MKTVLILGSDLGMTSLITKHIKENFSDDIVVVKSKQVPQIELYEIPTFKITNPSVNDLVDTNFYQNNKVGKGGRARNKSQFKNK